MDKNQTYTLSEAHLSFAKSLNNMVWELLQKLNRSKAEDEIMVYAAHASCFHWLQVGTGMHHQRAEWLIAHVYAELSQTDAALRHAARCMELTHEHSDLMEDFDWAYAYEGMARAYALEGKPDEARQFRRLAAERGQAIQNEEDRSVFLGDFNSGDWHGLK
jgi:hypothetical protein